MTDFNLLQAIDDGATTPQALLHQALPHVLQTTDAVSRARVYWLSGGKLLKGHSYPASDEESPAFEMVSSADAPAHYGVLSSSSPVQDDTQWIVPLLAGKDIIALVAYTLDTTPPDEHLTTTLADKTRQLALLMENCLLQQVINRQTVTAAELISCETFEDIARIFAKNMVGDDQFVSVTPFEFDNDGQIVSARVLSSANRQNVYSGNEAVAVDTRYIKIFYNLLDTEGALLIHDIDNSTHFDDTARTWLKGQNVQSMFLLPLYVEGRLQAFLAIIDTRQPLWLTPLERRSLHTLAQQASSTIEKRDMLSSAEASLEEQRSIYNLSEALMRTNSIPEILQTLYTHLEPDAPRINYTENTFDEEGNFQEFNVRYIMDDRGLREVDLPLHELLEDDQFDKVTSYWENIGEDLEIVEDYNNLDTAASFLEVVRDRDVGSSISLPIIENGQRTRQINLIWSHPRVFDAQMRRVLETARTQITLILRNRQLLDITRDSVPESGTQADVLQKLNRLMSRSDVQRNENTLLDETARLLVESTGLDHVGIALIDATGDTATIASEYPDTGSAGRQVEAGANSVADLLREKQGVLRIPDVAGADHLQPKSRAALESTGAKSVLFVPMFDLDGTLLGSIGLDSYTKIDSFDASTIDVAETIATQLAINLQKLRLLRGSQQHAVRMQQITAFGQSVQATLQVANILEAALDYSERVLPASYLAIMPYDRAAQSLRMDARLYQGTSQVIQSGTPVDMDENTVARAAWEARDLITIDDLQSNWEWKHPESSELRAMMAVPLMARGLLMGVMEVGSEQPGAYDLTSAAAFQQMSNQIAVALANADAYARSQKVARNKAIASEIVAELQQQTEVEAILQVTARELGKALGAKRARIRLSADTDITRDSAS